MRRSPSDEPAFRRRDGGASFECAGVSLGLLAYELELRPW